MTVNGDVSLSLSTELEGQLLLDRAEEAGFPVGQDRTGLAAHHTWCRSQGSARTRPHTCSGWAARTPCPGPRWLGLAAAWKDRGQGRGHH